MDTKEILAEIAAAKSDVMAAEQELDKLLRQIEVAARAEKTTISEAVRTAFGKLRAARQHLEKIGID
jgi:hypothetical protein